MVELGPTTSLLTLFIYVFSFDLKSFNQNIHILKYVGKLGSFTERSMKVLITSFSTRLHRRDLDSDEGATSV